MKYVLFGVAQIVLLLAIYGLYHDITFSNKHPSSNIPIGGVCAYVPDTVEVIRHEYNDSITRTYCILDIGSDSHLYFNVKHPDISGCVYSLVLTHYPNSLDILSVFKSGNERHELADICTTWAQNSFWLRREYREYFTEY
jgi:hypothetical protein